MDGDHAWFRARPSEPWHEIASRDDLELIARCGFVRTWTRSEQARGATAPGETCAECAARVVELGNRLTVAARD